MTDDLTTNIICAAERFYGPGRVNRLKLVTRPNGNRELFVQLRQELREINITYALDLSPDL